MPDVVRLILSDHEIFAAELDDLRDDPKAAGACWAGLAALLEMHASAEEEHFYPALLHQVQDSVDETKDAIGDHDDIRDGIRRAAAAEVGSDEWWAGVRATREANDHHIAEEERDDLPDFLRAASPEQREELGAKFQQFKDAHPDAKGLSGRGQGPGSLRRRARLRQARRSRRAPGVAAGAGSTRVFRAHARIRWPAWAQTACAAALPSISGVHGGDHHDGHSILAFCVSGAMRASAPSPGRRRRTARRPPP